MTQEHLQDALGMIDDDLLIHVDNLRQTRDQDPSAAHMIQFRKKMIRREFLKWGSLAAGICVLISVGLLWRTGSTTADSALSGEHQYSNQQNAGSILDDKVDFPEEYIEHMSRESETIQDNNEHKADPETAPETNPESVPAASWPTPPALVLLYGTDPFHANTGSYSWSQKGEDGLVYCVAAEALHPLECQQLLTPLETTQPFLQLSFEAAPGEPTEITAQCWSDKNWGDMTAEITSSLCRKVDISTRSLQNGPKEPYIILSMPAILRHLNNLRQNNSVRSKS